MIFYFFDLGNARNNVQLLSGQLVPATAIQEPLVERFSILATFQSISNSYS